MAMQSRGQDPSQELLIRAIHTHTASNVHPSSSSYSSFARNNTQPTPSTANNNTNNTTTTTTSGNTTGGGGPKFKPPAHKHAHHLHSIPPREKSTRTLIIDHMLWVHGRTRFAQARAELGMTDRTGGPGEPNYKWRQRPENYDEDEQWESEGEDVERLLKARIGVPKTGPVSENGDNDEEGGGGGGGGGGRFEEYEAGKQDLELAKVLRLRAEGLEKVIVSMLAQPPTVHPHPLEDDELLRTPPTSPNLSAARTPSSTAENAHKLPNGVRLRLALGTLLNDLFVRQSPPPPIRVHQQRMRYTSSEPSTPSAMLVSAKTLPPAVWLLASISEAGAVAAAAEGASPPRHRPYLTPSAKTLSTYKAGLDLDTANSPPDLRCPRHLHFGCELCVPAQAPTTFSLRSKPRADQSSSSSSKSPHKNGLSGWQDGCGVGSGLGIPAMQGSVLRRKSLIPEIRDSERGKASFTNLTELVPRFIRLSALVATELGMEAKESQGEDVEWDDPGRSYAYTLKPTREWYMLLVGLLTRCVLEGYLTMGWRGLPVLQCLLSVGLGVSGDESAVAESEEFDEFREFDPDELPSLPDAVRMLFPSLREEDGGKSIAEGEYEAEMEERLRKFYDIPASTPDLSTHMEDLAWLYPAEPVERAATRFCEAIAKWRGKPELETYKKKGEEAPNATGGRRSAGIERYFTADGSERRKRTRSDSGLGGEGRERAKRVAT